MDEITIINTDYGEFTCADVSELEGFETPTVRDVFIDPPDREGSLFIGELAGKRELSWRGLIREDNLEARRTLARVCLPGGLKTLQFETCDGLALQIAATVRLTNAYRRNRSPYLITAKAPYPYFQSQTLHEQLTHITDERGGLPIPAAIPAPLGEGGGVPFPVTNAGDTVARPIFEIHGPGTNFLVQNLETGELFRLQTTLASNEIAVIDTVANTAVKGEQNIFGLIERDPVGTWISLLPGVNNLVFSAITGVSDSTTLTIKWRDTYAGV